MRPGCHSGFSWRPRLLRAAGRLRRSNRPRRPKVHARPRFRNHPTIGDVFNAASAPHAPAPTVLYNVSQLLWFSTFRPVGCNARLQIGIDAHRERRSEGQRSSRATEPGTGGGENIIRSFPDQHIGSLPSGTLWLFRSVMAFPAPPGNQSLPQRRTTGVREDSCPATTP